MNDLVPPPLHPDSETIAAFVDGTLTGEELKQMSAHLRECEECRDLVAESARYVAENPAPAEERSRPAWWLAAAAVLVLGAGVWWFVRPADRQANLIAQLAAAAPADSRDLEPRLAGGFHWAPLRSNRAAGGESTPSRMKLIGVAGTVLERTSGRNDPESLHAAGVAHLLAGQDPEAVRHLSAIEPTARTSAMWNDLASAHYSMATRGRSPEQLKNALAAVDHALRRDPNMPEALFNRALIIDALGLPEEAAEAWRAFLARDSASDWAAEARRHLEGRPRVRSDFRKRLEAIYDSPALERDAAELVRDYPQESRAWAEGEILSRWGEAHLAGRSDQAARHLALAAAIGTALRAASGDSMVADAVAAITRASEPSRRVLATAHVEYRNGRIDYSRQFPARAEPKLRRASDLFRDGGSPMALTAAYFAANTVFDQNQIAAAHRSLAQIFEATDERYAALRSQLRWQIGLCLFASGRMDQALNEFTTASTSFRVLGERDNEAFLRGLSADVHENVGDFRRAWQERLAAVSALGMSLPARLQPALSGTARLAMRERDWDAATALLGIEINYAVRAGNAQLTADAFLRRAHAAMKLGRHDDAIADLARAREAAASLADAALRERTEVEIAVVASALDTENITADRAGLDRAIEFHSERGRRSALPDLYLARARVRLKSSDRAAALADLRKGLEELEAQRSAAPAGPSRWSYFNTSVELLAEAVRVAIEEGDVEQAYRFVEQTRGRTTLDAAPARAYHANFDDIPRDTVVVDYVLFDDVVFVFALQRGRVEVRQRAVDVTSLESQVEQFIQSIRVPPMREGPLLYSTLLEDVGIAADATRLVIVPDGILHRLPFAALHDRGSGRHLIERYEIVIAPSAAVYLASHRRLSAAGSSRQALVVGNPQYLDQTPVRETKREVEAVAALYPNATVLSGASAVRETFLRLTREADIVHFAGHGEADAGAGSILFLNEKGATAPLTAEDVARLRLDRTRLIVLAACDTARGRIAAGEGAASVARAFLDAGVPSVVGTLWQIDDRSAADLFSRFHRYVAAGRPAAAAVRAVQLDSIRNGNDARTWAAVQCMGGA